MSRPTPDARAVVEAVDRLTTHVQRLADTLTTTSDTPPTTANDGPTGLAKLARLASALTADALSTPVVRTEVRADDDTTTPATTCSAQYQHPNGPLVECIRAAHHDFPRHTDSDGCNWSDAVAIYPVAPPVRKVAHHVPAEAYTTWTEQAPAADEEQAQRWSRREPLLVLLTRLQRGRTLIPAEADTLRHLVEAEMHETETADRIRAEVQRDRDQHAAVLAEVLATFVNPVYGFRLPRRQSVPVDVVTLDKWRSVVAPTVERPWWVQLDEVRAELGEAQAATERVRGTLHEVLAKFAVGAAYGERPTYTVPGDVDKETFDRWCAALDGTEQPTTEQP